MRARNCLLTSHTSADVSVYVGKFSLRITPHPRPRLQLAARRGKDRRSPGMRAVCLLVCLCSAVQVRRPPLCKGCTSAPGSWRWLELPPNFPACTPTGVHPGRCGCCAAARGSVCLASGRGCGPARLAWRRLHALQNKPEEGEEDPQPCQRFPLQEGGSLPLCSRWPEEGRLEGGH